MMYSLASLSAAAAHAFEHGACPELPTTLRVNDTEVTCAHSETPGQFVCGFGRLLEHVGDELVEIRPADLQTRCSEHGRRLVATVEDVSDDANGPRRLSEPEIAAPIVLRDCVGGCDNTKPLSDPQSGRIFPYLVRTSGDARGPLQGTHRSPHREHISDVECRTLCGDAGFEYAGLQAHRACFCGNSSDVEAAQAQENQDLINKCSHQTFVGYSNMCVHKSKFPRKSCPPAASLSPGVAMTYRDDVAPLITCDGEEVETLTVGGNFFCALGAAVEVDQDRTSITLDQAKQEELCSKTCPALEEDNMTADPLDFGETGPASCATGYALPPSLQGQSVVQCGMDENRSKTWLLADGSPIRDQCERITCSENQFDNMKVNEAQYEDEVDPTCVTGYKLKDDFLLKLKCTVDSDVPTWKLNNDNENDITDQCVKKTCPEFGGWLYPHMIADETAHGELAFYPQCRSGYVAIQNQKKVECNVSSSGHTYWSLEDGNGEISEQCVLASQVYYWAWAPAENGQQNGWKCSHPNEQKGFAECDQSGTYLDQSASSVDYDGAVKKVLENNTSVCRKSICENADFDESRPFWSSTTCTVIGENEVSLNKVCDDLNAFNMRASGLSIGQDSVQVECTQSGHGPKIGAKEVKCVADNQGNPKWMFADDSEITASQCGRMCQAKTIGKLVLRQAAHGQTYVNSERMKAKLILAARLSTAVTCTDPDDCFTFKDDCTDFTECKKFKNELMVYCHHGQFSYRIMTYNANGTMAYPFPDFVNSYTQLFQEWQCHYWTDEDRQSIQNGSPRPTQCQHHGGIWEHGGTRCGGCGCCVPV